MSYKYSIPKRKHAGKVYTREELYKEYYPIIIKLLIMKKKDLMDAEDITQNVFLYLLEMWDDIKWESIENLLSLVLYQRVVRYYQKFDVEDNITGSSQIIDLLDCKLIKDPLDFVILDGFRKTLQESLALLTKREKECFFAFYFEDRSVEEIADGKHTGTVKQLLSRARIKVSDYFAKNYSKD